MMRMVLQHAKHYRIRTSPPMWNQTLQHRLTEALDRNAQVTPVLQQWRKIENQINPSHVTANIKKLRDSDQTLQVSEWMRREKICLLTREDFEKMREVGVGMKPSPFNSMLSLRGMEDINVAPDYNLMVNKVLRIYAAESKVKSMARFMRVWSGEEGIKLERGTLAAMANAYSKAGSTKKAIEMYGGVAGSSGEVHRLWDECKKKEKLEDDEYRNVISSLLKLDDVEGAKKVYGEWKPAGPKLECLSIPGLWISRFWAERNELKVGKLISSIGIIKKRTGMHLRMVRAFIVRVVQYVAIGVFILCVVVGHHLGKLWPWILFFCSRGY